MLSQVALATLEAPSGKRLGAHLFIHVLPERIGDAARGQSGAPLRLRIKSVDNYYYYYY